VQVVEDSDADDDERTDQCLGRELALLDLQQDEEHQS
jgi:hypothetical protein